MLGLKLGKWKIKTFLKRKAKGKQLREMGKWHKNKDCLGIQVGGKWIGGSYEGRGLY